MDMMLLWPPADSDCAKHARFVRNDGSPVCVGAPRLCRYNHVMDVCRGVEPSVAARVLIDVHSFTTHCNAERARCHLQVLHHCRRLSRHSGCCLSYCLSLGAGVTLPPPCPSP
jgi:hypothetical protein